MAKDYRTYREKLLDPRWQRKRLEVLEAAGFTCAYCQSAEKTLHVHHGYYRRGAEGPWDYPMESLHCLCEDCHTETQEALSVAHQHLARLNPEQLQQVAGYAAGMFAFSGHFDAESTIEATGGDFLAGILDAIHLRDWKAVFQYRPEYPTLVPMRWLDELQGAEFCFLRDNGKLTK